ncbi:MAG: TetR/AcrR family transcriptional regulator [Alphaproteobacteria bacterium]|nr:TetR/AcrR family transcriptional regulator [Alphaproteobacteria bacterium]
MSPSGPRAERKRAAILAAAEGAFRERGYHGVSMDGIAERAEVSKRTIYNHFEGKDALFAVIVRRLFDGAHDATRSTYDPTRPVADQLRAVAEGKLRYVLEDRYLGLFRAVFADLARVPALASRVAETARREEESLVTLLRAANADGQLQVDDPAQAAAQFWALLKGVAFWPVVVGSLPPEAVDREGAIQQTLTTFLSRYGAAPGDPTQALTPDPG